MSITEAQRHQLHQRLEEWLGPDHANVLMEHLPPVGWADVATKRDLDLHAAATKRDLDSHAAATKQTVEHQIAAMGAGLRAEIQGLRTDMAEMQVALLKDQRTHVYAALGLNAAIVTVALALVRLI